MGWFEQALHALGRLPSTPSAQTLGLDIRLNLRVPLGYLAQHDRALAIMREADEIAMAISDWRRQAGVRARMMESLRFQGQYDAAVEAGEQAMRLAAGPEDGGLRAYVLNEFAMLHQMRGELRRAADALREIVGASAGPPDLRPFGLRGGFFRQIPSGLAWVLSEMGEFDEALAQGLDGVRLNEASEIPTNVVISRNILSFVYLQRGDAARAAPLLDHPVDLDQVSQNNRTWMLAQRGATHTLDGDIDRAIPLLEEALRLADASGVVANRAAWETWLGEAYLAAGRVADARRIVDVSLVRATAGREWTYRVYALRAVADIAACDGLSVADEVESRYREALDLAVGLEMRPIEAHCHLGLGKLYRRVGRPEEARAELATAVSMLREMGMAHWLPEAEAEMSEATR